MHQFHFASPSGFSPKGIKNWVDVRNENAWLKYEAFFIWVGDCLTFC
jgi:hypothetical protein